MSCLNPNYKDNKRLISDFSEVKVSMLFEKYFKNDNPSYEEFIKNKNVKEELNIIPISQTKEEIGISLKKEISNNQLIKLKTTISKLNNKLRKENQNVVYLLFNINRIGQADLFSWGLRKIKGKLNVDAKLDRITERIIDVGQSTKPVTDFKNTFKEELSKEETKEKPVEKYSRLSELVKKEDQYRKKEGNWEIDKEGNVIPQDNYYSNLLNEIENSSEEDIYNKLNDCF